MTEAATLVASRSFSQRPEAGSHAGVDAQAEERLPYLPSPSPPTGHAGGREGLSTGTQCGWWGCHLSALSGTGTEFGAALEVPWGVPPPHWPTAESPFPQPSHCHGAPSHRPGASHPHRAPRARGCLPPPPPGPQTPLTDPTPQEAPSSSQGMAGPLKPPHFVKTRFFLFLFFSKFDLQQK